MPLVRKLKKQHTHPELLLGGMILVMLGIKFYLVFTINVNWDEFAYLGRVYEYNSGNYISSFQSFTVVLYSWLPAISGIEVDQIIAARISIFILQVGTAILIARVCCVYSGLGGALFTVLCYLSFSYVIEHGTSFRHDTVAVFLGMLSMLFLSDKGNNTRIIISGVLFAIAILVTPKSLVFALLASSLLLYRARLRRDWLMMWMRRDALFFMTAFSSLAFYVLWYNVHLKEGILQYGESISNATTLFISTAYVNTGLYYFTESLWSDYFVWLSVAVGLIYCVKEFITFKASSGKVYYLGIILFITPLGAVLIYRNMFPYFYVLFMPIVLVLAGISYRWMLDSFPRQRVQLVCVLLPCSIFITAVHHSYARSANELNTQRLLLEEIHAVFDTPVHYIDWCSMVSSFHKVGFFMTSAGMKEYKLNNNSVFPDILSHKQPVFVLANNSTLKYVFDGKEETLLPMYRLTDTDSEVLYNNYIHHWSDVYIAGKRFQLDAERRLFEVYIEGAYTLESDHLVEMDGQEYMPGTLINLVQGTHAIYSPAGEQTVVLRWGENTYKPNYVLEGKLFYGF